MKGDVIKTDWRHKKAADALVTSVLDKKSGKLVITVSGESGSGKSETAVALKDALENRGLKVVILQQDDYFYYPPKTNEARRRADLSWVGRQEVNLELLDQNISQFKEGADCLVKPLVIYNQDKITEESLNISEDIMIVEGTYTGFLKNPDYRVFIDRTYEETLGDRLKRDREPSDTFLEKVLRIEHEIIKKEKELADYIVSDDFSVKPAS